MNKAKEYIKKYENTIYSIEDIIKIAQKDAIEATLGLAAEKVIEIQKPDSRKYVSKNSILSLKDELFKQLD